MNKLNNIKRSMFALIMCLSITLCGCGSNKQTEDAGTLSAETQLISTESNMYLNRKTLFIGYLY